MILTSTGEDHDKVTLMRNGYLSGAIHRWHCRFCGMNWQLMVDALEPLDAPPHFCAHVSRGRQR